MSTGDQTEYLRVKIAERGLNDSAKFSTDGFDAWAESERPARVGGMEKTPAESQMSTRVVGGVRKHMKRVMGGRTPAVSSMAYMPGQYEEPRGSAMRGGAFELKDLIDMAQKLYDFYQNAKTFTATVKEDLRSPDVPTKYKPTATLIADTLDRIGLGKAPHVALGECMQKSMGRRGGASAIDFVKDMGGKLVKFYNWFLENKQAIHYVLKMKSINPPGYEYAQNFEKLLTSVGLGKNPGSCSCTSSGGARTTQFVRTSNAGKYDEFIKMYNEVMSSTKESFKKGWLKQNEKAISQLREMGLIGGAYLDFDGKTSVAANVGDSYIDNEPSYGKTRSAKSAMRGSEEDFGVSREEMYSPPKEDRPSMMQMIKNAAPKGGMSKMAKVKYGVRAAKVLAGLNKGGRKVKGMFGEEYEVDDEPRSPMQMMANVAHRKGGRAPSARNLIVKKVMAEHGLSLPQASKYVKEHNLY